MAGLLIKDLPEPLHHALVRRAAANHRSLAKETLCILEAALDDRAGPPPLAAVDALRVVGRAPLTDGLLDLAKQEGRP